MKYLSKINITVFATFSILLLISVSFVLCNLSIAHYKTRIIVDTVKLEITPYQPVDTTVEESIVDNTTKDQQETLEKDVISNLTVSTIILVL